MDNISFHVMADVVGWMAVCKNCGHLQSEGEPGLDTIGFICDLNIKCPNCGDSDSLTQAFVKVTVR